MRRTFAVWCAFILLFLHLCSGGVILAQKDAPMTVKDYYLTLPDRYIQGVSKKHRKELIAPGSGRLVALDIRNGYLQVSGDAADPGFTVALFKRPYYRQYFIAVSSYNEMSEEIHFLTLGRDAWEDVTHTVLPGYDKKLHYDLPRHGTTILVKDDTGKMLYKLFWASGKFTRHSL